MRRIFWFLILCIIVGVPVAMVIWPEQVGTPVKNFFAGSVFEPAANAVVGATKSAADFIYTTPNGLAYWTGGMILFGVIVLYLWQRAFWPRVQTKLHMGIQQNPRVLQGAPEPSAPTPIPSIAKSNPQPIEAVEKKEKVEEATTST